MDAIVRPACASTRAGEDGPDVRTTRDTTRANFIRMECMWRVLLSVGPTVRPPLPRVNRLGLTPQRPGFGHPSDYAIRTTVTCSCGLPGEAIEQPVGERRLPRCKLRGGGAHVRLKLTRGVIHVADFLNVVQRVPVLLDQ